MFEIGQAIPTGAGGPTGADSAFWSWSGLVAMCAVLVLICRCTDKVLRERGRKAVLKGLERFEARLVRAPIREWQKTIAKSVVTFWIKLGERPYEILMSWMRRVGRPLFRWGKDWGKRFVKKGMLRTVSQALVISLVILVLFLPFTAVLLLVVGGIVDSWFFLAVCVPAAVYMALIPIVFQGALTRNLAGHRTGWFKRLDGFMWATGVGLLGRIQPACLISAVFSIVATFVGLWIGARHTGSYWFTSASQGVTPTHPILLTALNFPFDLATILISIKLLKWVASKGKWIVLVAAIDIVISAALVTLLHTVLKSVEAGDVAAIGHHFAESWSWFAQVLTLKASPAHPDWPLTPLLLTTFIPVAVYMSAFIFLGIVVRPFAWLAGLVCGMFSGDKKPFTELGVIISLLGFAGKALSEWDWLRETLSGS